MGGREKGDGEGDVIGGVSERGEGRAGGWRRWGVGRREGTEVEKEGDGWTIGREAVSKRQLEGKWVGNAGGREGGI